MDALIILVLIGAIFLFIFCMCDGKKENYWSLPFAGGDVRTFAPDPHRIEGEMGRILDENDGDANSNYPI